MSKKKKLCSICGAVFPRGEMGFSPEPVKPFSLGTCCVKCYRDKVIPARIAEHNRKKRETGRDPDGGAA